MFVDYYVPVHNTHFKQSDIEIVYVNPYVGIICGQGCNGRIEITIM